MELSNPLQENKNLRLLKTIPSNVIIEKYKNELNIDVKRFFNNVDKVYLYKDITSGYGFYYPFISGDDSFYRELQKFEWYYSSWKWEHQVAKNFIKATDIVLEIGCATGSFLEVLSRDGIQSVGLEINKEAVECASKKNIRVINETVEEHAKNNKECYDVVCSFQVMEHIPDVYNTIQSSLACLKKNGTFIISVPDNNSYLKKIDNVLNYPPHHNGLWNKKVLQNLTEKMNLTCPEFYFEPLNNLDFYYREIRKIRYKKYGYRLGSMINNFEQITKNLWYKKFPGFRYDMTIMAIFIKK
jgi:2-polyprenyl-3-methyl-5-hydroxy-6-metoxy-1,4-benzoquinol methylase